MLTRSVHLLGAAAFVFVVGVSFTAARGQAPATTNALRLAGTNHARSAQALPLADVTGARPAQALRLAEKTGARSAQAAGAPDLNGLWQGPYTPNLAVAYGKDLPFTTLGRERWEKVDTANDPTGFCLPVGPARGIQAPFPFQIVQTPGVVAILFEYQRTYRMIYTDGRKPPADIHDYPEWMGFSTGRWEGGTLVVDTVAINDRSWLDTAGHEHSDKLRLTERFKKIDEGTIEWSVTFDDPVFFAQPWTVTRPLRRPKSEDRIMSYSCEENNKDIPHLKPTKPGRP